MSTALWVRVIRHHRTAQQITVPCGRDDPEGALAEACHALDLSRPLWLEKNSREWRDFAQTRFLPDAFLEGVDFERLEIEFIDPNARKKASRDPRNE